MSTFRCEFLGCKVNQYDAERARRGYIDGIAKALFAIQRSAAVSWNDQVEATRRIY